MSEMPIRFHRTWIFLCFAFPFVTPQFYTNNQLKLLDILKPSDTHRLFDTLQFVVEEQYTDSKLSFDVSTLYNYADKPISIERLNRRYSTMLYEGDMAIGYEQLEFIVNGSIANRGARRKFLRNKLSKIRERRQAYVDANYPATIWENGVPFVFHSSLSKPARDSILNAIHFWYSETCIDFHPRTSQKDYLLFIGNDDGCWSTVGRDTSQGRQVVSIGKGCEHFGVTSHELAHALGVFHEQSRFDRDESVVFNSRVVDRELLFNFAKVSPRQLSTYTLPYDVGSVMHYTPTEFSSVPSIPTLVATDVNLQQTMGQLEGPSFLDVVLMNKHYNCEARCPKKPVCQNGGFVNSRNCTKCKCPTGFGGDFCDTIASSFSASCGGILRADETVRRFDITIRQGSQVRDKTCVYHLQAPMGKKILIDIVSVKSDCIEGCWKDGIEIKMRKDVRPVGYRYCCPESSRRKAISDTNLVPFMVYSKEKTFSVSFQYAYVDANARFDEEQRAESAEIIERSRNENDGISSSISVPAPRILGILGVI